MGTKCDRAARLKMIRIEQIQAAEDGSYRVRFWMTKEEANLADAELRSWAEGGRVVKGWQDTYRNFRIALETAKRDRPDLSARMQRRGPARGAIWSFSPVSDAWRVAVDIRGDILLDFAAVLKNSLWHDEAVIVEEELGVEIPPYPENREGWNDHFWQVLEPIYRRCFEPFRWQG